MPTINTLTATEIVDFRDFTNWEFEAAGTTSWGPGFYSATDTDDGIFAIQFSGSGFNDILPLPPTEGILTSLVNDTDNDGTNDIAISGLNIDLSDVELTDVGGNGIPDNLFQAVLAGDDTFFASNNFDTFMMGDAVNVAAGTTLMAGDDFYNGTDSAAAVGVFYGDAYINDGIVVGGDDTINDARSEALNATGEQASGDVYTNNAILIGGDDTITLAALADQLAAGDAVTATDGSTTIGGNDILTVGSGLGATDQAALVGDVWRAETGAYVEGGADRLNGGSNIDIFAGDVYQSEEGSYVEGGEDLIYGGGGGDLILGEGLINVGVLIGGNDTLFGQGGNDFLSGDSYQSAGDFTGGDDVLDGGNGNDILMGDLSATDNFFTGGDDVLTGGNGSDTLFGDNAFGIFSIPLLGTQNITNAIAYEGGNDTLNGGAGDDFLGGGGGDDMIDGGDGIDTAMFGSYSLGSGVIVNLSTGTATDEFGDTDTLISIENVSGSESDDNIVGDAGTNVLEGLGGNDTIAGGNGNDTLLGGDGDDTIFGNGQRDEIDGGTGNDSLFGGSGRDFISGQSGADILFGGNGNDVLHGGGGSDRLNGEAGSDTMIGGSSTDFLDGGAGNDNISGGNGADFITGGAGNDTLTGGDAQQDTFIFANSFGQDLITDFIDGTDQIDFSGHTAFNTLQDVLNNATDNGTTLTIQLNAQNTLVLDNMTVAQLDASDFVF